MREIKFRCWDTENKQMLKVQELDFEDTFYGGRLSIRADMYNDYFDIEDMILMQYTGIKDKNGKEIYEGDIIKICAEGLGGEAIGKIVYDEYDLAFVLRNEIEELSEYLWYAEQQIEVIGNIYDNPKLLEKGE